MKTGKIFFTVRDLLHRGHFWVTLIACFIQMPQKIWPHLVEWGCRPTDESIPVYQIIKNQIQNIHRNSFNCYVQTAHITEFACSSLVCGTDLVAVALGFWTLLWFDCNLDDPGPLSGEHKLITVLCSPTNITSSSVTFITSVVCYETWSIVVNKI